MQACHKKAIELGLAKAAGGFKESNAETTLAQIGRIASICFDQVAVFLPRVDVPSPYLSHPTFLTVIVTPPPQEHPRGMSSKEKQL